MSALLMTSLLSGCGGGQADAEKTQEAAQTQAQGENQSQAEAGETAAVNPDATEVLFWISLSGGMGETIEEIVNNYNASQDKVHVRETIMIWQPSCRQQLLPARCLM